MYWTMGILTLEVYATSITYVYIVVVILIETINLRDNTILYCP